MAQTPEQKRAYMREYYQRNREAILARQRERGDSKRWRGRNPEKSREYSKRWREKNPDQVREKNRSFREQNPEYGREWKQKNRENIRARERGYRAADPERFRAATQRYREAHPEKVRETLRRYRERYPEQVKMSSRWQKHRLRPEDWAALWGAQDGRCYLCKEPLDPEDVHVDHDHSHCGRNKSCSGCRRGLTHPACNQVLGMVADNVARLRQIADSLEQVQAEVEARLAGWYVQTELGVPD